MPKKATKKSRTKPKATERKLAQAKTPENREKNDRFLFSVRELSVMLGVSPVAIGKWNLEVFKKDRLIYYDIREAIKKRLYNVEKMQKIVGGVSNERARLLAAQADLAELKFEEESKRKVDIGNVTTLWNDSVIRIRARLLMAPKKYSREFPDPGFALKILKRVVADVMSEIREIAVKDVVEVDSENDA